MVTCVYVNPVLDRERIIDYRRNDPDGDGFPKLDPVREMLSLIVYHKRLPFEAVLMDSWYAAKWLMLDIESLHKLYYCPLKSNRQINESGQKGDYHRVDSLSWTPGEQHQGKTVHLKGFPKGHQVNLFRLLLSAERTDYVVTNDRSQHSTQAVQQVSGYRWKVEQFHREEKQLAL